MQDTQTVATQTPLGAQTPYAQLKKRIDHSGFFVRSCVTNVLRVRRLSDRCSMLYDEGSSQYACKIYGSARNEIFNQKVTLCPK